MTENFLFIPIAIGRKRAENRFVINAMECCDSDELGNPSPRTYRRYAKLFEGNAGVIFLEAITVSDESRALAPVEHHASQCESP